MADIIHFDTLEQTLKLQAAGMGLNQAISVVNAIQHSQVNLATRADISKVKTGINWLKWAVIILGTLCVVTVTAAFWIIAHLYGVV